MGKSQHKVPLDIQLDRVATHILFGAKKIQRVHDNLKTMRKVQIVYHDDVYSKQLEDLEMANQDLLRAMQKLSKVKP